jgi:hypothetical protein
MSFPKYGKHRLDYYFTEEHSEQVDSKRFRVALFRYGIQLKNVEKAPSTPDDLLQAIIEYLIERAKQKKNIDGKRADRFSLVFRSSILEKPIQVSIVLCSENGKFSDWI